MEPTVTPAKNNPAKITRLKMRRQSLERRYFQGKHERFQPTPDYSRCLEPYSSPWAQQEKRVVWGGTHSQAQWMARVEYYGWRCRYCNIELTCKTLTKDHQIPIAHRGTDWASNLVPCCKSCNSWKGKRTIRVVS